MAGYELPGMVEVSHEAHEAGTVGREWRATYPFGVTVTLRAVDVMDAYRQAGDECLLLEDLAEAEGAPTLADVLQDPGKLNGLVV